MNRDNLGAMKNRPLCTVRVALCLPLLVAVATGCGCGGGSSSTADLSVAPAKLTLTNVPTGCPTTETAADRYSTVVASSCALANCHGTSGLGYQLFSAADMRAQWIDKPVKLYSTVGLSYITPGDLNKSFIMYKLTGSQGQYGGMMPSTGALTSAQICKFVAWIGSGAN